MDLRKVKGLTELDHLGPFFIELQTVQLPQDGSALHFYTSKDGTLARRLHAELQDKGVRCWFAPHDMKPGTSIRQEIDKGDPDTRQILLSKDAIESGWVHYKVEQAITRKHRQRRTILFPLRLDDTVLGSAES